MGLPQLTPKTGSGYPRPLMSVPPACSPIFREVNVMDQDVLTVAGRAAPSAALSRLARGPGRWRQGYQGVGLPLQVAVESGHR